MYKMCKNRDSKRISDLHDGLFTLNSKLSAKREHDFHLTKDNRRTERECSNRETGDQVNTSERT